MRRPLPAASACQKERVVSTSREEHGGHVVIDHSPQAGSGEWWTGGASHPFSGDVGHTRKASYH